MGARVIAAASSDEKLAVCRARGAAETINYSTQDLRERLKTLVGEKGVDVVYDPVGGALSEPALRSIGLKCSEPIFFSKLINETTIDIFLTDVLESTSQN